VSLAATVSGGFLAGECFFVYVVLSALPPRYPTRHCIVLELPGGADPSPSPWPKPSALSDRASFILEDAADGIEEEDLPFPPAAAEIQAAVSFNGDSLVRLSYADDPDLVQLVSVVDLRRAPGLIALDFSWFAFGGAPSLGSLSLLEGEHYPSGSLSRESLAGKLPPWGFIPRRDPNPALDTRDKDHDYRHSWVQPSHFCEGGGMGLFFSVPQGQVLPAGTLLGVYLGRSGESLKIKYKEALKLFRASEYVVDHSPFSYVVDGQHGNTICGPARSNDNFDIVNCYFAYNPLDKRVELFTNVPTLPYIILIMVVGCRYLHQMLFWLHIYLLLLANLLLVCPSYIIIIPHSPPYHPSQSLPSIFLCPISSNLYLYCLTILFCHCGILAILTDISIKTVYLSTLTPALGSPPRLFLVVAGIVTCKDFLFSFL
jgi:hypothetical protein